MVSLFVTVHGFKGSGFPDEIGIQRFTEILRF